MTPARRIGALLVLLALAAACTPTPAPPTQAPTAAPPASVAPEASPTLGEPAATPTPATVEITVYFTDRNRVVSGTPPFEATVTRTVPADANLPEAVLAAFFAGPTADEQARGLELITDGFTGVASLVVQGGIAHLRLSGPCNSNGATYTIASPLIKNLTQFSGIQYVKIYDERGDTADPSGPSHSIPACLEP